MISRKQHVKGRKRGETREKETFERNGRVLLRAIPSRARGRRPDVISAYRKTDAEFATVVPEIVNFDGTTSFPVYLMSRRLNWNNRPSSRSAEAKNSCARGIKRVQVFRLSRSSPGISLGNYNIASEWFARPVSRRYTCNVARPTFPQTFVPGFRHCGVCSEISVSVRCLFGNSSLAKAKPHLFAFIFAFQGIRGSGNTFHGTWTLCRWPGRGTNEKGSPTQPPLPAPFSTSYLFSYFRRVPVLHLASRGVPRIRMSHRPL